MGAIDKFQKSFTDNFEDSSALVISPSNRFYLSGFSSSDGIVLVTPKSRYLIVDFRYYEMAKEKNIGFEVVLAESGLLTAAKAICSKENVKKLVLEDEYLTVAQNSRISELFSDYEIAYFKGFFEGLRAVKSCEEVRLIKESQKLTDAAFEHILSFLKKGITENDVAAEIEFFFKKNGAEIAFNTVAVSGKKSACPHGEPSDVVLTNNSFLTMDFGAKLDGYCSDMTRTVVIGKADEEMKKIYDVVLKAQLLAIEKVKSGVLGCVVDSAARDYISKYGYGNAFGHSTGHGVGIDVHEAPAFSPNYKKPIPEMAVLSVEPGIYLEGKYGVRIEDMVVVLDEKYENLTKSTKKLIELN